MNKIKITLTKEARTEALMMRELRGLSFEEAFEGPVFDSATLDILSTGTYVVTCEKGEAYYYPANTVARVAVYDIK